jgi:hypothetical protein|tara:strand:- start:18 stop:557 length:540 start_codon:yes stop_codon:yes gene_type:complete
MSVLNVIDTQTVSGSGTSYIVVKSGVLRCYAASASTIAIDGGPAITLAAGEALLVSCGKVKTAKIAAATNAATMVVTAEGFSGGGRHTFSVGDFVQTIDGGDTDGFTSDFESAAASGKKVTAVTGSTITTDYDASGAGSAYTLSAADATAGTVPVIQRCAKLVAGSNAVIVEQVQIVGG